MMKILIVLTGMIIISLTGCSPSSPPGVEQAAVEAALDWLSLIDGENYEESWERAASFFKGVVPKEKWGHSIQSVRKPMGRNLSRNVKSKKYLTTMPGAPDGEYVVIQFKASFENKKSAIETITPMMDVDGVWRVSGYYIK